MKLSKDSVSWWAPGGAVRRVMLGAAMMAATGCGGSPAPRLPPETSIDEAPPAITNQAHVRITFHATDMGSHFECQLDGGAPGGCGSPFEADVSDGEHRFRVHAAVGNAVDNTPAEATWKVDTVPPDTTILMAPPALDNSLEPAFTFQGTDDQGAVTFECALDDGAFAACTSPTTVAVVDGSHRYRIRAVDAARNVDPSPAETTWTVDSTAPDTEITSGPANGAITGASVSFAFNSPDSTATFECKLDAADFATCAPPRAFTLGGGSHTFAVRAKDPVGQVDPSPATRAWTVDTTPPDVTITATPSNPTNAPTGTFAFSSTDATATFKCQIDAGAFAACMSGFTSPSLADGSHTFTVRATDPVGNSSTASFTWTIDTVAPVVNVTAVPTPTNNNRPSVTFTVTGATTIQCQVDATGTFAACTSPFTPATALADGSHTITVRGTDAAGNRGTGATTFTVDTVAPVVNVTAVTTPTNVNRPSVVFTVTGATTIQCQVDSTGTFAACTSPFTPATALADGSHTITVRGTDAVGNRGTGATTFTVDTAAPGVAFDDSPPAVWPVNYFDMKFHSADASATFTCSLNGAAFAACTSPRTITTVYNASSTFAVRATDPAGNVSSASRSWTSRDGLVLHYPWEFGSTLNTSLLTQKAAYSPNGSVTLTSVGGWAGGAAASPVAHQYANTIRALSSSANGAYTMSVWARLSANPTGTVVSTMSANTTNGFALSISGGTVTLQVKDNGTVLSTTVGIPLNQWVQLGIMIILPPSGPIVGLLVNGALQTFLSPQTTNGFGPGQAPNLTVGPISNVDLDDLRFYNRELTSSELCTTLVRGQFVGSTCVPLIPGIELDFEHNQLIDTGNWHLPLIAEVPFTFVPTALGMGMELTSDVGDFAYTSGFAARATQAPGHSLSLWFVPGPESADSDGLIDFLGPCAPQSILFCGIDVHISHGELSVSVGAETQITSRLRFPLSAGLHSVLVTEQKVPGSSITQSVSIYLDGQLTVMPLGTGNVFRAVRDDVPLATTRAQVVDEIEFWPRDLSADLEMLCENGLDGEWDPVLAACQLPN